MDRWNVPRGASLVLFALLASIAVAAHAKGDLRKVNHVIIVMQENHSFDNYFGALPYVPDGPYHAGPCRGNDHRCVDGLTCERKGSRLECKNWNLDAGTLPLAGEPVHAAVIVPSARAGVIRAIGHVRQGPEIVVERMVLLHHDDDV